MIGLWFDIALGIGAIIAFFLIFSWLMEKVADFLGIDEDLD